LKSKFVILKPYGNIDWERQELSHLAEIRNPCCLTEEELIKQIKDVHLLIGDVDIEVTEKVLDSADKLRGVICASTGIDFVDVTAATERGIVVTNLPDYCVEAVAEHTLALMFCLCRHIMPGAKATLEGNWEKRRALQGIEVEGKTLGIVGLGKIGRKVAEKAKALGMQVAFYSPSVPSETVKGKGYEKKEMLMDLVNSSDFISIHTSYRDKKSGMFGEKEFKNMKPTAYFINVARGGLSDEKALYRALKERWIAGAAVDVLLNEPPEMDNPLFELENIVITPHIAYNTKEAKEKGKHQLKLIITQIINNQFPINVVNPEVKERWCSNARG
jgi:D-3-phosphoglycerate dehydrogenase